jgi:hypothetical protein
MRLKPHNIALALAALLAFPLAAGGSETKAAEKPAALAADSAMKAHIDPVTGQLVSKADPSTKGILASAPAVERLPLKVEKGMTKAGGKRVRLDDRFMMGMTATAAPDGKVSTTCETEQEKAAKASTPAKEHRHDR